MSQDSILPPLSPEPRISEDIDDSHEQWSDAPETFDADTVDRGIQEVDHIHSEDITLKHATLATSDDAKTADAPTLDTTLDGPSPLTRSPTERAFDNASVQSLPTVQITEPQSPGPRPQTATAPSFNANSTEHISPSPTRSVWSSADTSTQSLPRRSRPRSTIADNRASNRLSGFFSNLIHRRDNPTPSSPREAVTEERPTRTPDRSLPQSRASSPAPPARPVTPPPQLPAPTLQELGLSLSVFTNILSPSHFSTPPTSGAFLAPHFLLLCHAQGLDVLPLVSPPAPAPYALIRRVSFKSVVVMEHRGVLVAIAGRRDGVRVYALEEVKKAVEWRLDVEIRRQRDRARREEAKRSAVSRDSTALEKAEKRPTPSGSSAAASAKTARRASMASSTTVGSKAASSKKAKSPARPPQLPPPAAPPQLPQLPSVPPPSYSTSPPSRPLRSQNSLISMHPTRSRSGSVTNVLGGTARRNAEAAILGPRDADAKSDWMDGHASEEEAIDVVAAGERGSEALDERTSAMAAASATPLIGRPEAPPLSNRPLSSATLTQQSVRRPRPANLDLNMNMNRTGSQASPPPPSPTPTLVTLRQALAASPSSSYLPTMGSMSSRMGPQEPPTPDGEDDEDDDAEGNRTPRSEEISFAEALRESRIPDLPPPGSRRTQEAILITASHPVASGEDDAPASPMSADAESWRTRQSTETSANRRRRRWSVLGGVFAPPPDEPPTTANHSHPQSISSLPSAPEMQARRNGPLARSQSTAFRQPPIPPASTSAGARPSSAQAASAPPSSALARSVQSETELAAPRTPSRFLSRILGHAFTPRRSEDSGASLAQRTDQVDPGWKLAGTPNGTQPAPAPKLEYVKLPGTKGSLMIKAVETSKKSFLAILCGDNGEKVELFAGTYRTALGLSRTFILPDSPRSLELQLQGDDLVEVFLMFSQNVFGLEPATVRVREVRIGRAERRAARRRARELRGDDAPAAAGAEPDATASEEPTNVNVSIGVSVSSSTTVSAGEGPAAPSVVGGITASSSQAPSDQLASTETPQSTVVQPTEELVALATAQMGPYTTFQQLSFAPNFPLAAIADDYIIPPTYPDFLQYRTEYEPEVNGSSQVDLSQVQFSPPGLPQPLPAPPARWFYRDPKSVVHGPWKASLMQAWYRDGLLPPDLPVRREEDTEYILLKDLRQQSVDPTQPFGLPSPKTFTTETLPVVPDGKPLLAPISLLSQPKIFGPPALFFSSRGGHSTVIVDGRGRSVLKGRLMWSTDEDDDIIPARLGDVKRLEAFDVKDKSVLVAMRQGGLEAVDLSDALLRPADASRTALPHFTTAPSQVNRRAPYIWRIGMPVSSPSPLSAPTALALSKPPSGRALVHKKHAAHHGHGHGRTDLGGADMEPEHARDEVIFLGRQEDNIYLCERNAGAFRILRLCPAGAA
ncbi:hypothetical protein DENSPDRAFT_894390 [Dentipellis sp. KUC8613]|nr:hypothetical protein DENSPDRAFT_894390 [Dentipellis sp. KUC8613]